MFCVSKLSKFKPTGVSHKKVLHLFWLENLLLNIKLEPSHYDLYISIYLISYPFLPYDFILREQLFNYLFD